LFSTDARGRYELALADTNQMVPQYLPKASELGYEFPYFEWSNDGISVYYVASKEGRSQLFREKLGGEVERLAPPRGSITGAIVSRADFAAISWSSIDRPNAAGFLNLNTSEVRVVDDSVRFVPEWIKDKLSPAQEFRYKSFDGKEIHGFMIRPQAGNGPQPCILAAHGGPWWNYSDTWRPSWQAFAACGYVVIGPNFRGSTGYGPDFQFANLGDAGGGDLKDIAECRRWLERLKFVDGSRVAISGGSYGGYLVNLAMTKLPELWAAGVSFASFTDWREDYELADASFKVYDKLYMGGTPEEKPELYRDRSPYYFAENLRAPLLLEHPENDSRCPLQPVQKFYDKLVELGKDVRLRVYKESGHAAMQVRQEIETYVEAINFLNARVR
jgi:dipeptidyl aminopeptidase/acylaminoacyl peptidase